MSADFGRPLGPESDEIRRAVAEWVRHPCLVELAAAFGFGGFDADLGALLEELDRWSAVEWDGRRGGERREAVARPLTPEQDRLVAAAATSLGMRGGQRPDQSEYDLLVVLGGAAMAPLLRTEYAAAATRGIIVHNAVLLGSGRELDRSERELTERYACAAETEFDLMAAAARQTFGLGPGRDLSEYEVSAAHPFDRARVRYFESDPPVSVLWAPTGRPGARANTGDTVRFLARTHGRKGTARVLAVTSPQFVTFQQADLISDYGVPLGASIETIGFPDDGSLPHHQILQEIRSAVRSMRRLLVILESRDVR